MPGHTKSAIEFKDISLRYSKRDVTSDFSASVPGHGITVLLGRNGSGKTTLLRALIKCIKPWKGEIRLMNRYLDGIKVGDLPKYISYAPAELDDGIGLKVLNVVSNTKANGKWIGAEEALRALDYLGVRDLSEMVFNELSTGQKRLVLIARTMAAGTPIVLLDEPTSGLDPNNRQRILRVIRKISKKGMAIIIATQDLDVALEGDWIIGIKGGRVLESGPRRRMITSKMLTGLYDTKMRVESFKNRKIVIFER